MAKVTQVVLVGSKSYADRYRKFKQNTPVTLTDPKEIERYRGNALFAVREIEQARAKEEVGSNKPSRGDPYKAAVNEETTRLPQRKKKAGKKLTPKQGE